MEFETLIYEKEDRIATLTLNRSKKGYAIYWDASKGGGAA